MTPILSRTLLRYVRLNIESCDWPAYENNFHCVGYGEHDVSVKKLSQIILLVILVILSLFSSGHQELFADKYTEKFPTTPYRTEKVAAK